MAESHQHRRLVLSLANFTRALLAGRYEYQMSVAQRGRRFPQAILGYVPDLRAFGYVKDEPVEIVGEAETEISSMSIRQLSVFLHYVEGSTSRALVVAVPLGRIEDFPRALKRNAKNWHAVKRRVLILD